MIVHLVLFRPRRDLSSEGRRALTTAFETALRQIPSIRRARVGRQLVLGRPYEALMAVDYPYIAILEFDDRGGFAAYLEHPAHGQLAAQFFGALEEALIYDVELVDGTAALAAL